MIVRRLWRVAGGAGWTVAVTLALPAVAQDLSPAIDPWQVGHGILVSNIPLTVEAAQPASPVQTRYRPSAAVSARVAQTLATESEKLARGSGAEMRAMVTSGKPMREFARLASGLGLARNDAADALAFYLVAQWGVATDYRGRVTRAQMTAVRDQVRAAFPTISGKLPTDAKRQEFAETLINQGVLTAGIHEAAVAAGMESRVAQLSRMARRGGTRVFGGDPGDFELTDRGLIKRR